MSRLRMLSLLIVTSLSVKAGFAEEHEHQKSAKVEHGHANEHEEETENPSVGVDKGITEVSHEHGFKLSVEAVRRFILTARTVSPVSSITIPRSAILTSLEEKNLYRIRDGFYKRIDFKTVAKSGSDLIATSPELRPGDQVVISGIGFLRIAEIASEGGGAAGHSH